MTCFLKREKEKKRKREKEKLVSDAKDQNPK
jgi:hypothetical protein